MKSQTRIDYHPDFYFDKYYHVYNRAVGKDKLFFSDENYKHFLNRYSYYLNENMKTYAFCLLPNHFHLLVSPKINSPQIIIEQFRKFFISYSMPINIEQKRKGNLFQTNFKRKIIDDESYLLQIVYYIHANPMQHNITTDFIHYPYSSYKKIIGLNSTRLQRTEVLSWFNGNDNFIKYHEERKSDVFNKFCTIE